MSDLSWSMHGEEQAIVEYGAYCLRTNVSTLDEKSILRTPRLLGGQ